MRASKPKRRSVTASCLPHQTLPPSSPSKDFAILKPCNHTTRHLNCCATPHIPYLNEAPDLNIIFNVGYQAARQPEMVEKNDSRRYVNDNSRWSGGHDGTHDPKDVPGILAILGPQIQGGKQMRAHLWDIAPTILNLMSIPIPNDMDGKPLPIITTKRGETN